MNEFEWHEWNRRWCVVEFFWDAILLVGENPGSPLRRVIYISDPDALFGCGARAGAALRAFGAAAPSNTIGRDSSPSGPKTQARTRRFFWMQWRLRRANGSAAASRPYLEFRRALPRRVHFLLDPEKPSRGQTLQMHSRDPRRRHRRSDPLTNANLRCGRRLRG